MRTRSVLATSLTAALVAMTLVSTPAALAAVDETIKPRATTVAAGSGHTVVVDGAGRLWGVGSSADGQLSGVGTATSLRPIAGLPAGVTAVAVDAGPDFTLVAGSNGIVYGTGANDESQLTGADGTDVTSLRPLAGLPTGVRGVAVTAGSDFALVVGDDGRVYGTGENTDGQLTGTADRRTTLTPLSGLPSGVRAVGADAGSDFSVVVDAAGQVYGTGSNASRQLTSETQARVTTLTAFTGLPSGYHATAVAAGAASTSVLLDDRSGVAGQPPAGPIVSTTSVGDVVVSDRTDFVAVGAHPDGASVLAVGVDGHAYGMGANGSSQLTGTGTRTSFGPLTQPDDLDKAVEVATGANHTLVRDARGVVYSTGSTAPGVSATTLTSVPDQKMAAPDRPTFLTGETVRPGHELSANSATWVPVGVGSSTFQWRRNGADIAGATGQVYTVSAADHGATLAVVETRTAPGFQSESRQSEGVKVAPPVLRVVTAPRISGRAAVGSVLSASDAAFEPQPETLTRAWRRNGRTIAGASGPSYRLTTADAGTVVTMAQRGTKPDGDVGELVGTASSGGVKVALLNRARPTIRGTAKVGRTLKLKSRGTWYGPQTYTYRWYRGSKAISGATRTSYKLKKADRGKKISLRVSGRRSGFTTLVVSSAPSKKVTK